ncbi:MAG TPA: RtcB family protein [Halanaerobiales bacterium]|nr:RtcB family protein [Halanaerobiales bacterium]
MSKINNFFEVKGRYATAKVFSFEKEKNAVNQITNICNNAAYKKSKIRIMPDYHKGKGSVIGFTSTLEDRIIPNAVGVDINCGMYTVELGNFNIDFNKLDNFIKHNIPHGFKKNKKISNKIDQELKENIKTISQKMNLDYRKQLRGVGSLGGGNHFIEINESKNNEKYLVIHTGSRNFGLQVCNYHQNKAINYCKNKLKEINDEKIIEYNLNKNQSFLEGELAKNYYTDMKVAQKYANENRRLIAERILEFFGLNIKDLRSFQTRHNYIDFKDKIIRKGAISAHKGEMVLIPLNMRDGSILARGKGNEDWNFSAPHGAGRIMSRTQAKKEISLENYKNSMKNVFSTSVSKKTLDEAPFAYKNSKEILNSISETVEIIEVLKPVYNFKAS